MISWLILFFCSWIVMIALIYGAVSRKDLHKETGKTHYFIEALIYIFLFLLLIITM